MNIKLIAGLVNADPYQSRYMSEVKYNEYIDSGSVLNKILKI